jgi:hypothetical protein
MAEALTGRRKATGGIAESERVYQRPEGAPIEFFQPRSVGEGAGTGAGVPGEADLTERPGAVAFHLFYE